jgi:integrase
MVPDLDAHFQKAKAGGATILHEPSEGVHLHDLRHTGNQLTANAGANLKELMAKMGHDSERAALIYLHSSGERQW